MYKRVTLVLVALSALVMTTAALAQVPDLSPFLKDTNGLLELGVVAAPFLLGILNNWLTHLGKDIKPMQGWTTRFVALGISVVTSAAVGFFSLGGFDKFTSWQGAGSVVYLVLVSWITAMAKAAKDGRLSPTIMAAPNEGPAPSAAKLLQDLNNDGLAQGVKEAALGLLGYYYPPLAVLGRKLLEKRPLTLEDLELYNRSTQSVRALPAAK